MRVARVLPDVPALDRTFDYLVPDALGDQVRVGSLVRVDLHGRRVGAWVVELDDTPATDRVLKPIARWTGDGPSPELVDLSAWAAWRWAGRRSSFLRTASPPGVVRLVVPRPPAARNDQTLVGERLVVVPPAADVLPVVLEAAGEGDVLVVAPTHARAVAVGRGLRAAGRTVALAPRDWSQAAAGGCDVVGARAAAWAPVPDLAAVVVVDEHDEALQEERAPTWHARDVARERARRAGVPFVATSPCPSLDAVAALGPPVVPGRAAARAGWPLVDVVDLRREDPRSGLYSERLVAQLRSGRRVVCVLNRKGRARLLACAACGDLARCERCASSVEHGEADLVCRRCGERRPVVCASCGATRLKNLRAGVTRVREELEALANRPVGEVVAETDDLPRADVLVGTEAVLHRVRDASVDTVVLLDLDQELLAPRFRAAEQALALVARAAATTGGRARGARVLLQTRQPDHPAVLAALHADPAGLAAHELVVREALRFPPCSALAAVSGPPAGEYVDPLRSDPAVDVLATADGRFLVRAADHAALADALAAVPRPPGRLRIEVDPLRV